MFFDFEARQEMMDQGTMADVDGERFAGSALDNNEREAAMDALMVGIDPDNVPAPVADKVTDKVIRRIIGDTSAEDNVPF